MGIWCPHSGWVWPLAAARAVSPDGIMCQRSSSWATCPLRLLRTRGSDRRAELRLTHGSGQPLSTARWPTGKSPARALKIGHSQDREMRICPEADQSGISADAHAKCH